ncbi:MAG TPA: hypothetical protein VGK49_02285 [Ilumatobacteraceae bacterium]
MDDAIEPTADVHDGPADEAQPRVHPPAWGPFVLAAFVGLVVCTNIAGAVWARWSTNNPEGLLALSSRNRYLVLTLTAGISLWSYALIATLRLSVAFVVCHLIGRAYRGHALNWFTRYLGISPESLDAFQRGFEKAQWVLVPFFVGSNIVAVLSGIHRTTIAKLTLLVTAGIAGRLVVMWWLARTFEDPLTRFLKWVDRYQWWLVALSVVVVVLVNVRNFRRGAAR